MSYVPTTWVDGETQVNAENLNKLESAVKANDDAIYEINTARANGEFKGEQGDTGPAGPAGPRGAKGESGPVGEEGKSAYAYAQEAGFTGTEEEFAELLTGNSVYTWGAIGTDAAINTQTFQTALANSRVVKVPGGTYKLNGELVIGDNCCLELSQDTVLEFTQTAGNCIVLGMSSTLKGNHATVKVPYTFDGHVLHACSNDSTSADIQAVPPWSRWDPQWKSGRYVTDLNICKADSRGFHYAVNPDECKGTAVYISADNTSGFLTFMWGVHYSGLRIAGAFAYGIHAQNFDGGWLHEMRIDAFIDACETGVCLEDCSQTYIFATIQPRRAYTTDGAYKAYAKHGIQLIRSKNTDLSGSRIWDWNSTNTLYTENGEYQHISMIGDCSGTILNDYMYHGYGDTRKRIYTDTPSNLAKLTILQEPITRWFKTVEGVPYYFDGNTDKKLATRDELDTYFDADMVKGFTDVLATATDTDGTIYNGIGYKAGYRLNTDGTVITGADTTYTLTGFMPCAVGQKVYVEGMSLDTADDGCRVCLYDANKNFIRFMSLAGLIASGWYVKGEKTEGGFWFSPQSVVGNENTAFVRFNVYTRMVGEYPMVAVDEEIKYTVEGFLADGIKTKGQNVILYSPAGKAYGLAVDDNGNVVANEIV